MHPKYSIYSQAELVLPAFKNQSHVKIEPIIVEDQY